MNFNFSETEKQWCNRLREQLTRFAREKEPQDADEAWSGPYGRQAMTLLSTLDYLKPDLSGRLDPSPGDLGLMGGMEILAEISPSLFLIIESSARLFGRAVAAWGSGQTASKILKGVESGRVLGAMALSEKSMNVDNDPLETFGVETGGRVAVTGCKRYVVNGPVADWIAVVGRLHEAHAVFLVKKGTPGMRAGPRLRTMGFEGVPMGALQLDGCSIPPEQVLLPSDSAAVPVQIRQWEDQILTAACLGLMRSSLDAARQYAATHHSGGKPIVAYQEVAFKLAEMLTLYQTSQLLAYRAAWMVSQDPGQARELTWCAKVLCAESAEKVAGQALQILAGEGYQRGNPAELAYRCAKYAQIAGTSTEIARMKIGDAVLGYRPRRIL